MSVLIENENVGDFLKQLQNLHLTPQACRQYVDHRTVETLPEEREEDAETAKARKRKRPRHRSKKSKEPTYGINFLIKAVTDQSRGRVCRKRNHNCQYVSSFLCESGPHSFKTRQCWPARTMRVIDESSVGNETPDPDGKRKVAGRENTKRENLQSAKKAEPKKPKKQKAQAATKSSGPQRDNARKNFDEYLSSDEVEEGLKSGHLVKGPLRINPKNYRNAYVSHADRNNHDYILTSIADRNRALDGDVVIIRIKPEETWVDQQQSAEVVYIFEKIHPRTAIGTLQVFWNQKQRMAAIQPRDLRVPRIIIPKEHLPPAFFKRSDFYENVIYKATISEWKIPKFALGTIEMIGKKNDLKDETKAILEEYTLNVDPFPESIDKFLPKNDIAAEEFSCREDLRKECVFTIDPLTARDLDDAVSCKTLPNGNLEIGVHIADVSYYLFPDTHLDQIVAKKATTIYLVDQVFHMLPVEMCLHLSLLPGKDSLAFSVFWEMTPEGEILSHRFSRTVINNCSQLAYEHAQKMIDNEPLDDLPQIHNGFKDSDLKDTVLKLQKIADNLRKKRFDSGALRIDQVKIVFRMDDCGDPIDFFTYENKEAHRLIEEFMLLANITVAKRILNDFPDIAFLRCHEPPNPRLIGEVQKLLELVGIHLDTSSSAGIHASLQAYTTSDFFGTARNAVLNHLLAKPMTRARYFCASIEDNYEHYALSIPIYTHFTSPIRRYADIMVHRLLSASLGYTEKPKWTTDFVREIAANCNKQKYNAKRAGEVHSDLFLVHYIEKNQPFIREAVVVEVREKYFDVLVLCTGSIVRIHLNDVNAECTAEKVGSEQKKLWKLQLTFDNDSQKTIEIFQIVQVALKRNPKTNGLQGELVLPQ